MREILFRGMRLNGTEWFYGDYNLIEGKTYIFNRGKDAPLNSPDWYEVKPETVGQYTGMNDKHGNKIFEGDIISYISANIFSLGDKRKHEIIFGASGSWHVKGTYLTLAELINNEKIAVIGNITDNPDLLKTNENI